MTDIKTRVQGISPDVRARNIHQIIEDTDNIYQSLVVISKRAKQISVDLKSELHSKLEEFAVVSDTIEEILENKEQIEISKFYERLPNPAVIATEEFLDGTLQYRKRGSDRNED